MVAHRRSMVAGEGWPWLIILVILGAVLAWYRDPLWSLPFGLVTLLLFLLFRDPQRQVPPLPLGVLAPIDGVVTAVESGHGEILYGEWQKITIRTNHFGAYTIRAPIEGSVRDIRGELTSAGKKVPGGLCIRSEEQDDVVLLFPGRGIGLHPKAFVRYGERVGQGQRFAYLRLAPRATIYVPATAKVLVERGQRVLAGFDRLAELASKSVESSLTA